MFLYVYTHMKTLHSKLLEYRTSKLRMKECETGLHSARAAYYSSSREKETVSLLMDRRRWLADRHVTFYYFITRSTSDAALNGSGTHFLPLFVVILDQRRRSTLFAGVSSSSTGRASSSSLWLRAAKMFPPCRTDVLYTVTCYE